MELKIKPMGLIPKKKIVNCPGCKRNIEVWLTGAGIRKVCGAYTRDGFFECLDCGTEFEIKK